jgi:hypothetical protein
MQFEDNNLKPIFKKVSALTKIKCLEDGKLVLKNSICNPSKQKDFILTKVEVVNNSAFLGERTQLYLNEVPAYEYASPLFISILQKSDHNFYCSQARLSQENKFLNLTLEDECFISKDTNLPVIPTHNLDQIYLSDKKFKNGETYDILYSCIEFDYNERNWTVKHGIANYGAYRYLSAP